MYPKLSNELPPISVWIEETGYFLANGDQRILVQRPTDIEGALSAITALACEAGREVHVETRFLNKTIGGKTCPCLAHLVQGRPYVAFGPNDVASGIHQMQESVPGSCAELCAQQFVAFLKAMLASNTARL